MIKINSWKSLLEITLMGFLFGFGFQGGVRTNNTFLTYETLTEYAKEKGITPLFRKSTNLNNKRYRVIGYSNKIKIQIPHKTYCDTDLNGIIDSVYYTTCKTPNYYLSQQDQETYEKLQEKLKKEFAIYLDNH